MPDDLTHQYRLLAHTAALVGEFDGSPEQQKELLAWALEAVRAIAAARGLDLEAHARPEPMPHHISRELWPAQGEREEARESPVAWNIDGDVPRLVTLAEERESVEAGAGPKPNLGGHHYPGCEAGGNDLAFYTSDCLYGCGCWMGSCRSGGPDGVDPFGDCPNRPVGREWEGHVGAVEAGAGFAPGELARAVGDAEDADTRIELPGGSRP